MANPDPAERQLSHSSLDSVAVLVRRLAEAEAALQAAFIGVDAVINPDSGVPILLSEAQHALRRSEVRYNQLMARIAAVVLELDPNGTIEFVNDAASTVTGYHPDELLGQRWHDVLFPGEHRRQVDLLIERFADGDVTGFELNLVARDGRLVTLEFNSANQYRNDGVLEKIVGLGIDITQRKLAERELARYHEGLEHLVSERTAQLQAAVKALNASEAAEREQRVLAEALHEIALKMIGIHELPEMLETILAGVDSVVVCETMDIILLQAKHMAHIAGSRGYQEHGRKPPPQTIPFIWREYDLLRQMEQTRQPLIVSDVRRQRHLKYFPSGKWGRSIAGVPIVLQNESIGFIILSSSKSDFFTPSVAERLQLLAHQAAFAVQSARQHEQAKALAASQERARLARDLHDAVSQTLFAASLTAEATQKQWLADAYIDSQRLANIVDLTRGAHAELRALLMELHPAKLREADLHQLLTQLTQATRSRKQLAIDLQLDEVISPPFDVKECLYRIAQETLNNIVKHASATHVDVRLSQQQDGIELEITDDGRGFDPAAAAAGLGLRIMQERALAIGAQVTISSARGHGTCVRTVWAPHQGP